MEKRKYAKVVSIRKLWYMLLCNFCFWNWTLNSFLYWHFSKICQISILNTLTYLCIKFTSLDIRLFYLRLIKKVLTLCKTLHYLDFDGRKNIYFWVSCYLCSTFLLYFKQKFKSVNKVFSCDDTSTFCFSNLLDKFFMAHYRIGSSYYSSRSWASSRQFGW